MVINNNLIISDSISPNNRISKLNYINAFLSGHFSSLKLSVKFKLFYYINFAKSILLTPATLLPFYVIIITVNELYFS